MIRFALIVVAILLSAASSAAASTRIRLDTSTVPNTLVYEESPGSSEASDLIVSGSPPSDLTFQETGGVTIEPPSVVLHLSRAARRALLHRKSVRTTLQVTASDPSGNSATSATGLRLR